MGIKNMRISLKRKFNHIPMSIEKYICKPNKFEKAFQNTLHIRYPKGYLF